MKTLKSIAHIKLDNLDLKKNPSKSAMRFLKEDHEKLILSMHPKSSKQPMRRAVGEKRLRRRSSAKKGERRSCLTFHSIASRTERMLQNIAVRVKQKENFRKRRK